MSDERMVKQMLHTRPKVCPYCKAPNNSHGGFDEAPPIEGQAIFICLYCLCPLHLDSSGELRRLTEAEARELIVEEDIQHAVLNLFFQRAVAVEGRVRFLPVGKRMNGEQAAALIGDVVEHVHDAGFSVYGWDDGTIQIANSTTGDCGVVDPRHLTKRDDQEPGRGHERGPS